MGDDEELPPLAVQPRGPDGGPAGAQQYDDTASMLFAARQGGGLPAADDGPNEMEQTAPQQPSDYQARLAALQERITRNQQMQEQGVNAAFERSRPSESEKWLAIAAALASPTQTGSLGETMGNVFQSLAGYKRGVRQAESTRQSELMRLRQAYDLAGINAAAKGLAAPKSRRVTADATGKRFYTDTGYDVPSPAHIAALMEHPERKADFDQKFGLGAADEILAQNGGQRVTTPPPMNVGGGSGNAAGGFRP